MPMMAIIDYRGYRLVAMAYLPIQGARTLVYGSADGGETVINSSLKAALLMRTAAIGMNLKGPILYWIALW